MKWAILGLSILFCAGQALAQTPDSISQHLAAADPAAVQKGIEEIRAFLQTKPDEAINNLQGPWLEELLRQGRCDVVADLALRGEVANPARASSVEALQRWRVQALLRSGKNAQALAAAKGLFNVAAMESTGRALLLLTEALQAARPEDPDVARRLVSQQIAGAEAHGESTPATRPGEVMASIRVDAADYQAALDKFDPDRFVINATQFVDLSSRGNLLLLVDRADEARAWPATTASVPWPTTESPAPSKPKPARLARPTDGSIICNRGSEKWAALFPRVFTANC